MEFSQIEPLEETYNNKNFYKQNYPEKSLAIRGNKPR